MDVFLNFCFGAFGAPCGLPLTLWKQKTPKHEIRQFKYVAAQNCAQRSLRSLQAAAPIAAENGRRSAIAAENEKKKCITALLPVQVPAIEPMSAKSYPSALAAGVLFLGRARAHHLYNVNVNVK